MSSDLLDLALWWRQLGVAIVPVHYQSKRPIESWRTYQTLLPTEDQLRVWFRASMPRNAAVICGHQGLVVLDFDDTRSYLGWRSWARQSSPMAATVATTTYQVITRRGVHVYVFVENDIPRCHKLRYTQPDGTVEHWGEIKGRGGYVIMAGSIHPSGHIYRAHDESAPVVRVRSLVGLVPEPPEPVEIPPVIPSMLRVYQASTLMPLSRIEEIKQRVDILSLVSDPQSSGNGWFVARCPFHDDQKPSFWINSEKGICGCYSGCTDRPLDVIGLYARLHNLTNKEAVRELAKLT